MYRIAHDTYRHFLLDYDDDSIFATNRYGSVSGAGDRLDAYSVMVPQ